MFNYIFKEYDKIKKNADLLMKKNIDKFKLSDMTTKLKEIMDKYTENLPQAVSLNLPKLKKSSNNKSKLKLPKLKKV